MTFKNQIILFIFAFTIVNAKAKTTNAMGAKHLVPDESSDCNWAFTISNASNLSLYINDTMVLYGDNRVIYTLPYIDGVNYSYDGYANFEWRKSNCKIEIDIVLKVILVIILGVGVIIVVWLLCDALKHLYNNYIHRPPSYEMVGITTVEKKNVEISDNMCSICLEPCVGEIGVLHCKHEFHSDCILQWFKYGNGCPLCRL